MPVRDNTIALVVQADTAYEARDEAVRMCIRLHEHFPGMALVLQSTSARPLASPSAAAILWRLWGFQVEGYREDLKVLVAHIGIHHDNLEAALEDLAARAAAFRIGQQTGWPVRLYSPDGFGISWKSNLEGLIAGFPDDDDVALLPVEELWVLLVDLEED